jgi:hypothetical protein
MVFPNFPCPNAITSLNYDTLIDKAMRRTGVLEPCYSVAAFDAAFGVRPRGRVPLLKLHGSANWRTCPTCNKSLALDLSESLAAAHSCSCGKAMAPMRVYLHGIKEFTPMRCAKSGWQLSGN